MPDELINGGGLILVDPKNLKQFLTEIVEDVIIRHFETPKEEKMLTIPQVCDMLDVDKSTLWHWDKEGYLKKIHIGGKPRYKESEVRAILDGGNPTRKRTKQTKA